MSERNRTNLEIKGARRCVGGLRDCALFCAPTTSKIVALSNNQMGREKRL